MAQLQVDSVCELAYSNPDYLLKHLKTNEHKLLKCFFLTFGLWMREFIFELNVGFLVKSYIFSQEMLRIPKFGQTATKLIVEYDVLKYDVWVRQIVVTDV